MRVTYTVNEINTHRGYPLGRSSIGCEVGDGVRWGASWYSCDPRGLSAEEAERVVEELYVRSVKVLEAVK